MHEVTYGGLSNIGAELEAKRQNKKDLEFMLWALLVMIVFVSGVFAYTSSQAKQVETNNKIFISH